MALLVIGSAWSVAWCVQPAAGSCQEWTTPARPTAASPEPAATNLPSNYSSIGLRYSIDEDEIPKGQNKTYMYYLEKDRTYYIELAYDYDETATDYDLYLKNEAGTTVGTGTASKGLEEFAPVTITETGTYNLTIVNDPSESASAGAAYFWVWEKASGDYFSASRYIKGKNSSGNPVPETYYGFKISGLSAPYCINVSINVPATLDLYEYRCYILAGARNNGTPDGGAQTLGSEQFRSSMIEISADSAGQHEFQPLMNLDQEYGDDYATNDDYPYDWDDGEYMGHSPGNLSIYVPPQVTMKYKYYNGGEKSKSVTWTPGTEVVLVVIGEFGEGLVNMSVLVTPAGTGGSGSSASSWFSDIPGYPVGAFLSAGAVAVVVSMFWTRSRRDRKRSGQ
ncbi:MAG: hypothetical protein ACTSU5_10630 [Promethearchaeota archaeon]